jgi:hypothetical protein
MCIPVTLLRKRFLFARDNATAYRAKSWHTTCSQVFWRRELLYLILFFFQRYFLRVFRDDGPELMYKIALRPTFGEVIERKKTLIFSDVIAFKSSKMCECFMLNTLLFHQQHDENFVIFLVREVRKIRTVCVPFTAVWTLYKQNRLWGGYEVSLER